jgi:putative Mg2+ transporter-C (MgtC) family protein
MLSRMATVTAGLGPRQGLDLFVALVLASLIGVEREVRQKSAGLRTHTLVGLGAALFMLVSKYGFSDVLVRNQVVVDPSRVAAQIVTGIGFIGGGLIFVRRDIVRGLTTAAAVWLTAAVGAAAGAGLLAMAAGVTAAHFLVIYGYSPIVRRLPQAGSRRVLSLRYHHGSGALRSAMEACTAAGFSIAELSVENDESDLGARHAVPAGEGVGQRGAADGGGAGPEGDGSSRQEDGRVVEVAIELTGPGRLSELVPQLSAIDGVLSVRSRDPSTIGDSP